MKITKLEIEGPLLIELQKFEDSRGFFTERFNQKNFEAALGVKCSFVQDNLSHSKPGVLRGLHYQNEPAQSKLISVLKGHIFDVLVDIRKNSPSFGKYVALELKEGDQKLLYVPSGFAHGFCVLDSMPAEVFYKVDNYWNPKTEGGLAWNDTDLNIPWPIKYPLVSDKDAKLPGLRQLQDRY